MDNNKFYGLYRGICSGKSDPEKRYKILVRVPAVTGDTPVWAEPCLPLTYFEEDKTHATHTSHPAHKHDGYVNFGVDYMGGGYIDTSYHGPQTHAAHDVHIHYPPSQTTYPKIGQGVWVMYEGGDPNYPVWIGLFDITFF